CVHSASRKQRERGAANPYHARAWSDHAPRYCPRCLLNRYLLHLGKRVVHPRLPCSVLVAQPPDGGDGAVGIHLNLAIAVQFILEAGRACERQLAVSDYSLILTAGIIKGPLVVEEVRAELLGRRVVAPVHDPLLWRGAAENGNPGAYQEVVAL